jgi:hypothetical protein
MKSTLFFFALLVVVIAVSVTVFLRFFNQDEFEDINCFDASKIDLNVENVEFFNGECAFSNHYIDARRKFTESAKRIGAVIKELPVFDDFTTTVAILKGDEKKYLIHISGTHGNEFSSLRVNDVFIGASVNKVPRDMLEVQPRYLH